jgi:hypothetical protein
MTSRVEAKSSELVSIFYKQTGWNLARTKFFVLMISALCKVQIVGFEKLASAFDSSADTSSSLRRIQRFMATYLLDTDLVAKLIFNLLPHKPPYRLAMDRTNWSRMLSGWAAEHQCFGCCSCLSRGCFSIVVQNVAKIWQLKYQ